jgi:hypothetical protein
MSSQSFNSILNNISQPIIIGSHMFSFNFYFHRSFFKNLFLSRPLIIFKKYIYKQRERERERENV